MVKKKGMCDIHQKDIEELKDDLKAHKSEMYELIDDLKLEILEHMKPPITKGQMITIILAIATYISLSIGFVNENRQNIKVNANEVSNLKDYQRIENNNLNKKIDKIYDVLLELKGK